MDTKYISFNEFLDEVENSPLTSTDFSAIKRVAQMSDVDRLNTMINDFFGFSISDLKTSDLPKLMETIDLQLGVKPISDVQKLSGPNSLVSQTGGLYYTKYQKYKNKYLKLKNKN